MPGDGPLGYCTTICKAHGFDGGYLTEAGKNPRNDINNPYAASNPYVVDGCACYHDTPDNSPDFI